MRADSDFTGSIPEIYENCLVPVLFAPYARDLAGRIDALQPGSVLELAAGTGAVTREIIARLRPGQRLVSTDLNQAMIDVAAARFADSDAELRTADAQALPFSDNEFDAVAVQFGVMFYPDRVAAHAAAQRVLRPGGHYIFSVWGPLEENFASQAVHETVMSLITEPAPDFIARVPFGYHDEELIRADLAAARFADPAIERVTFEQPPELLAGLVSGMCRGTPLAAMIATQPPHIRLQIEAEAIRRIETRAGASPITMSALIVTAAATRH